MAKYIMDILGNNETYLQCIRAINDKYVGRILENSAT